MKVNFEDSLLFQIASTARHFELLFGRLFKEFNLNIDPNEHLALTVIGQTKDCCQRDLAKIILKDRANTGKLAKKLEAKGLIKIEAKEKNKKPVKILTITKKGEELRKNVAKRIAFTVEQIKNEMTAEKTNEMLKNLAEFREIVKKAVKTNI